MASETKISAKADWEVIGHLETQGRISISDSSFFYDQPVVVSVEPGKYSVSVLYETRKGHRHIARARVATSEEPVKLGTVVGIVGVEFGQVGVCDRELVESAFDVLGDSRMPEYFNQLNTTELIGIIKLPEEVKMYIFRPGFGDGRYPVYEILASNGKRRGLEIDCLKHIE
jgi:hypothetical protein